MSLKDAPRPGTQQFNELTPSERKLARAKHTATSLRGNSETANQTLQRFTEEEASQ